MLPLLQSKKEVQMKKLFFAFIILLSSQVMAESNCSEIAPMLDHGQFQFASNNGFDNYSLSIYTSKQYDPETDSLIYYVDGFSYLDRLVLVQVEEEAGYGFEGCFMNFYNSMNPQRNAGILVLEQSGETLSLATDDSNYVLEYGKLMKVIQ